MTGCTADAGRRSIIPLGQQRTLLVQLFATCEQTTCVQEPSGNLVRSTAELPYALALTVAETRLGQQYTRITELFPYPIAATIAEATHLVHLTVLVVGDEVDATTLAVARGSQMAIRPTFLGKHLLRRA